MKKLKFLFLIILIINILLPSCKKGEDDPFISMRTRKARITGDWKLDSGNTSYTYDDTTESISFNGSNAAIIISNYAGIIISGSTPYSEKWTINKNNTFKIVKNNYNYQIELSGDWSFYNKNKELDLKNKEGINFRVTTKKYLYSFSSVNNTTETYSGTYCPTYLFFISQLKNKELVVSYKGSSTWTDFAESGTGTFTFIQDKD